MNLKISMPFGVFTEQADVVEIVVETRAGSFGLLPQRLDCVAEVVQGILAFKCAGGETQYVAVDGGVLAKTGNDVALVTRRAVGGVDLVALRNAVHVDFQNSRAREAGVRSMVAKIESALLSGILKSQRDR